MAPPWVFDRLQPGMLLGSHDDQVDSAALEAWQAIYGGLDLHDTGQRVPSAFASVLVMRAYLAVVSPRPPGNIHRMLSVRSLAPLPRDRPLRTTVSCIARELKGDRRLVRFRTECHALEDDAPLLVVGELELLWAA